jgi:hypothetical protein
MIRSINPVYSKKETIKKDSNDFLFWQSRPIEERVAALEEIRQEFNQWRYGAEQGFQRVYTIIKK